MTIVVAMTMIISKDINEVMKIVRDENRTSCDKHDDKSI